MAKRQNTKAGTGDYPEPPDATEVVRSYRERAEKEIARCAELEAEVERLKSNISDCTQWSVRCALEEQTPPIAPNEWRDVNMTWHDFAVASVDTSRLVGLELDIEGKVYLIGDVNPDGGQFGQVNQAWHSGAKVLRARVVRR